MTLNIPGYALSRLAERDLNEIADYTRDRWGIRQAARYIEELQALCQQLAETPTIGRCCEAIRPGLRRMEGGRHVVFYRISANGITVSRVLHQKMLPDLHER
ncbi:MAG: type II toxin-antitoxin system RelE/ParE family toxin [Acidobacteriaceae bacterium]